MGFREKVSLTKYQKKSYYKIVTSSNLFVYLCIPSFGSRDLGHFSVYRVTSVCTENVKKKE